jgi:WD40 repeat protein
LKELARFEPHSLELFSVAFSADSATLVTGGSDQGPPAKGDENGRRGRQLSVRLWDLAMNPPRERLVAVPKTMPEGPNNEFYDPRAHGVGEAFSVALSPDGKLLACAAGGAARVWKISGKEAEELGVIDNTKRGDSTRRGDSLDSVAFSPDRKTLAVGGYECRDKVNPAIYLWDLAAAPSWKSRALAGVERSMRRLTFSGDGKIIFATYPWFAAHRWSRHTGDGAPYWPDPWRKVVRWDVDSGRQLSAIDVPVPFNDFALAPDGRHLVTCNDNGTAYVFRLAPTPKAK